MNRFFQAIHRNHVIGVKSLLESPECKSLLNQPEVGSGLTPLMTVSLAGTCDDAVCICDRVPMPPGKSLIYFSKISRTWKVLDNEIGPGWKLKCRVLESPRI